MGGRSGVVVFAVGLGAMFSILYLAGVFAQPSHAHFDKIPTEPKVTQREALEIIENHIRAELDGIEEIRLAFPLYNYSSIEYEGNSEYREYRHNWRFGWNFEHIKEHPDLLSLPLLFVHANGTSYAVNSTDGSLQKMCDGPSPICPMGRLATNAASDRLVYGAEIAWLPFDLNGLSNFGWYTVDAETGQIVWNNIDYQKNRKPMPNVNFDNRTIRQMFEEYSNPPETAQIDIQRDASIVDNDRTYLPKDTRVTIGIDSRINWTNRDLVAHTVVSDTGYSNDRVGRFESELIEPNASYEYTFTEVGKYPYHCDIHPWMVGTIEVLENFA